MGEPVASPPWAAGALLVDIDAAGGIDIEALAALERREQVSVGILRGDATGAALAAAVCVDLLVTSPVARLGDAGDHADCVLRRATGIAGRKVAVYLAGTRRLVDASTARRWGLVSDIDADPLAAARRLAAEIERHSPVAVATILRLAHAGAATDWIETLCTGPLR